tara:strand:+ start:44 stop:433 length:390 start_codon:yes stop_codon:yes gene_type:complete
MTVETPLTKRFTATHEWIEVNDNTITVGITHHAQDLLGDIVFVDLPTVNTAVKTGDDTAVIESVKTAADVYAPIDGTIIEVNESLNDQPEQVNQSPEKTGWLYRMTTHQLDQCEKLLTESDYQKTLNEE